MSYENELPLDTPYNTELDDPANAAYTDLKEEIENVVSIYFVIVVLVIRALRENILVLHVTLKTLTKTSEKFVFFSSLLHI